MPKCADLVEAQIVRTSYIVCPAVPLGQCAVCEIVIACFGNTMVMFSTHGSISSACSHVPSSESSYCWLLMKNDAHNCWTRTSLRQHSWHKHLHCWGLNVEAWLFRNRHDAVDRVVKAAGDGSRRRTHPLCAA